MESTEQSLQDVLPGDDVNFPGGHSSQSSSSVMPEPVPYRPEEHSMHSDELEAPLEGLNVPDGQFKQADDEIEPESGL